MIIMVGRRSILLGMTILFLIVGMERLTKSRWVKPGSPSGNPWVQVLHVTDGDSVTIEMDGNSRKARLIGIDAPEWKQGIWGKRSRDGLSKWIERSRSRVRLELDVTRTDKYGRLLIYLWTDDGKLINEELLRAGFAYLLTIPPNVRYVDRFKEAQKEARVNRKGIWGADGPEETPSEYRRKHPRTS